MSTTAIPSVQPVPAIAPLRNSRASAFGALLLRDLTVLRKNLKEFIPRTVLQPLLLVFVFTYVFPKIGQGVGGSGAAGELTTTENADVVDCPPVSVAATTSCATPLIPGA